MEIQIPGRRRRTHTESFKLAASRQLPITTRPDARVLQQTFNGRLHIATKSVIYYSMLYIITLPNLLSETHMTQLLKGRAATLTIAIASTSGKITMMAGTSKKPRSPPPQPAWSSGRPRASSAAISRRIFRFRNPSIRIRVASTVAFIVMPAPAMLIGVIHRGWILKRG